MIKPLKLMLVIMVLGLSCAAFATTPAQNIQIVQNLFKNCSESLSTKHFNQCYTKNFILVSNRQKYSYQEYVKLQKAAFRSLKSLKVMKYQDWTASGDNVAARVSFELVKKSGEKLKFYVIFIIKIKDGKVSRLYEMTVPRWSDKLPKVKH